MERQSGQSNIYRVEVSGWDASEDFFVEQTVLEWNEDETKSVELRCLLREGCVVFLRLLQPSEADANFQIPCQVVAITRMDTVGRSLIRLAQMHPGAPICGTARASVGSANRAA